MGIDGTLQFVGQEVSSDLFGANIISTRGDLSGDGQYIAAIEDLGVSGLRYPGGSVSEYFFDIDDPDQNLATHSETGEVSDIIPLSEFIGYAEDTGREVTLVLPTRHYISDESDQNGDRYASVDEEGLRTFVREVASGKYGNAEIRAFEIGNEYWHSGGMNSVEYGRVAADMIDIVDDELNEISSEYPSAGQIDLVVQMGLDYGSGKLSDSYEGFDTESILEDIDASYGLNSNQDALWGSSNVNFHYIANELVMAGLEEDGVIDSVDGVAIHTYSYQTDYSRIFALEQVEQTWLSENDNLDLYVTEWNQKGITELLQREEDYGLKQAAEMINLVETFLSYDVDIANVWPLIQVTDNALNHGHAYDQYNVPGEMFKMMSSSLPGKRLLDFNAEDSESVEAVFDGFSVHGFADADDLVLYITSNHEEGVLDVDLDLAELVEGYEGASITILGVQHGEEPFSSRSEAEIEHLDPNLAVENGMFSAPLDPGEIVQIVIESYDPTDQLAEVFAEDLEDEIEFDANDDDAGGPDSLPEIPTVPTDEADSEAMDDDEEDDGGEFDGWADFGWLLALLPLAAALGLG